MKWWLLLFVASALTARAGENLKPGLMAEYFQLDSDVADFPKLPAEKKPTIRRVDPQVNVENCTENFNNTNLDVNIYVRWAGSLKIEKPGKYKLFLESDDGSRLFIDGKPVINNGGSHPMEKKACEIELAPGQHELKLEFFQGNGGMGCKFSWVQPGKGEEPVPESNLWHKAELE